MNRPDARAATRSTVEVEPFDPQAATEAEYQALLVFTNRLRAELLPDDPPTPLEQAIATWRAVPAMVTAATWLARRSDGRTVLGRGHLFWADTAENRHVAQGAIQVLPEERRRGLARRLLAPLAARMREAGRSLLIAETMGRVPAGAAFMERLAAERGLETHVHQLRIADLDRELARRWQARARERAGDFELGSWDGPYRDADLAAAAELHQVMNTQPLGRLAVEPQRITPQQLRQAEAALLARGTQRWTMIARERATGRFVGFTEVFWTPSVPEVLNQGDTGVFPEHRGRGLGRWLKAAMLERVLAERPQVRFVRTGNADSNAAMLKINQALGFRPYISRIIWQVRIEKLEEYLGRARG